MSDSEFAELTQELRYSQETVERLRSENLKLSSTISAERAAHEETKRKLAQAEYDFKVADANFKEESERHACERKAHLSCALRLADAENKLKELQEQKPVAYECLQQGDGKGHLTYYKPRDEDSSEYELIIRGLYAYPIDVEALLQQARKEETASCLEAIQGQADVGDCEAAIRARMK